MVEQIFLYCLGEAVARYGITLHAFIAMSNHEHLIIRDNHGNFPEFLAHFHKMVAKSMNALRGRWENFWATEQPNAVYLVEAEDRFDKLVYLLANPVADHLVERVSDWPGACSFGMHLSGRRRTVARPRCFFGSKSTMPEEVTLRLERLDGFESLTEEEWSAKLIAAVRAEEERASRTASSAARVCSVARPSCVQSRPTCRRRSRRAAGFVLAWRVARSCAASRSSRHWWCFAPSVMLRSCVISRVRSVCSSRTARTAYVASSAQHRRLRSRTRRSPRAACAASSRPRRARRAKRAPEFVPPYS